MGEAKGRRDQPRASRRAFLDLSIGAGIGGGLVLSLGGLLRARNAGAEVAVARPIRACILLFWYGGPSHLDTFDMKPSAPADIRGEFASISTAVPGVQICEHLPGLARVMDKIAIVRSMHHEANLHDSASIHALTGRPLEGPDRELFVPTRQFYPSHGSVVSALNPAPVGEVPFASLPHVFRNVHPVPCQGGGFLGAAHDPLLVDVDPVTRTYPVDALLPRQGSNAARRAGRLGLLSALDHATAAVPGANPFSAFTDRACRLLESEAIRDALDVSKEPAAVREAYGFTADPLPTGEVNGGGGEMGVARQMRGQNLLVARRLVEAGVPFVNVYDYRQQGQNWDAHAKCASQHKNHLLPIADRSLAALITDLDQRGLLESTLVVAMGEFGRTPKINSGAGRDHWPHCYSVLLAGGGIQGGAVHGQSDRIGAHPLADSVTPGDLAATIFWRFGIDPAREIHDPLGRPHRIATGSPIRAIF